MLRRALSHHRTGSTVSPIGEGEEERSERGRSTSPFDPSSTFSAVRVLVLGCGISELSYEVWKMLEEKAEVDNVDFSVQAIEECRRRWGDHDGLTFEVADVRNLDFPALHFDLIIDKATLDCLQCQDSLTTVDDIKKTVAGLQRLIKVNGALISLSHSPPDQRLPSLLLDRLDVWKDAMAQDKVIKARRGSEINAGGVAQAAATPVMAGRRTSLLQMAINRPTATFSHPVVHRIPKLHSHSTSVTRAHSSSVTNTDGEVGPSDDDATDALGIDGMEESEHYLYIIRKEVIASPPQTASGGGVGEVMRSSSSTPLMMSTGLAQRRSSAVHERRSSALGLVSQPVLG